MRLADVQEVTLKQHKSRAAAAIAGAIKHGVLPKVTTLLCLDCGRKAEHYHHFLGYDPEHYLDVQALCRQCHAQRPEHIRKPKKGEVHHYLFPWKTGTREGWLKKTNPAQWVIEYGHLPRNRGRRGNWRRGDYVPVNSRAVHRALGLQEGQIIWGIKGGEAE